MQNQGLHRKVMSTLTKSIFKYEGLTYRDSPKEHLLAQHVLGLSLAVAQQPYKVRAAPTDLFFFSPYAALTTMFTEHCEDRRKLSVRSTIYMWSKAQILI